MIKNPKFEYRSPKQIRIWKILISILFSISCFGFSASASAATFSVEADTGRGAVNAIEGRIVLPQGISVGGIYTGRSAISIWITVPEVENGIIEFAGITPGGFRGKYELFSVEIESAAGFYFDKVGAYRNDGSGESVPVKMSLLETVPMAEDSVPPESFELEISRVAGFLDGRYFASFAAQDKGVGIGQYEYQSTWFLSPRGWRWESAHSPLVLSQADTFKRIHVRAVDHAGNFRTASASGPYRWATIFIGVIIILCFLLFSRRLLRSY